MQVYTFSQCARPFPAIPWSQSNQHPQVAGGWRNPGRVSDELMVTLSDLKPQSALELEAERASKSAKTISDRM